MKIGIITMHRGYNYGSVLQAFALQQKINQLGCDAEIIDYVPHRKNKIITALKFLLRSRIRKITKFVNSFLICSKVQYSSQNICINPPIYDVYCTGSDQVWNPRFTEGGDTNYMLSFVPENKPKISYASSFSVSTLPKLVEDKYAKYLSDYRHITVREKTGVDIIKQITGKQADLVCDPVLLLSEEEWSDYAKTNFVKIKENYILVYILGYMYNPEPYIFNIIRKVQNETGYKVYYICTRKKDFISYYIRKNSKVLIGVGPFDFINFIANAKMIITDSFHGSAFANIYGIPLISVVKDKNGQSDERIISLLAECGNEKSLIVYNGDFSFKNEELDMYKAPKDRVDDYRNKSLNILINILKNE